MIVHPQRNSTNGNGGFPSDRIILLDDQAKIIFSCQTLESSSTLSFKTSTYGYTFSLRVCKTAGYLSIFIALHRGEFDPILFYPFTYDIVFCLYDQSGQRKHIITTLKADPQSSSFARPTNEKNNEVGIVDFCPLAFLTDRNSTYMKDGVYFIGVFIDFLKNGINPFQQDAQRDDFYHPDFRKN